MSDSAEEDLKLALTDEDEEPVASTSKRQQEQEPQVVLQEQASILSYFKRAPKNPTLPVQDQVQPQPTTSKVAVQVQPQRKVATQPRRTQVKILRRRQQQEKQRLAEVSLVTKRKFYQRYLELKKDKPFANNLIATATKENFPQFKNSRYRNKDYLAERRRLSEIVKLGDKGLLDSDALGEGAVYQGTKDYLRKRTRGGGRKATNPELGRRLFEW